MANNCITEKARVFAVAAHQAMGHTRKYTGEPYIHHPTEVVSILKNAGIQCPNILAAAWLHDVVEDTGVNIDVILLEFGQCIAELVSGLTSISKLEDGNRWARKAIDREHTAAQSPECKTIKLADIISNCRSIHKHDALFARVYLAEKRQLLEVLRGGNEYLWKEAFNICCFPSVEHKSTLK